MIDIKRDGSKLSIVISETGLISKPDLWFTRECASSLESELLYHELNRIIFDRIEKVRKLEYEKGWFDKTKKLQKCKYFFSSLHLKASS